MKIQHHRQWPAASMTCSQHEQTASRNKPYGCIEHGVTISALTGLSNHWVSQLSLSQLEAKLHGTQSMRTILCMLWPKELIEATTCPSPAAGLVILMTCCH